MKYCIKCGSITKKLINHHEKYLEIDGHDKIIMLCRSCHQKLHIRRRREGKCNVSVEELSKISYTARGRRPEYKKKMVQNAKQYHDQNTFKIGFDGRIKPYVRLREQIRYNYKTGNVSISSYFQGDNKKKLFFIDIDN